jgi:hypothetical protein
LNISFFLKNSIFPIIYVNASNSLNTAPHTPILPPFSSPPPPQSNDTRFVLSPSLPAPLRAAASPLLPLASNAHRVRNYTGENIAFWGENTDFSDENTEFGGKNTEIGGKNAQNGDFSAKNDDFSAKNAEIGVKNTEIGSKSGDFGTKSGRGSVARGLVAGLRQICEEFGCVWGTFY